MIFLGRNSWAAIDARKRKEIRERKRKEKKEKGNERADSILLGS